MKQLLRRAGIDRPVAYGGLSKLALAASQFAILVLIAVRLAPDVQGYYYTYLNLTALQVFAELGLSIVIVQLSSHLWASLKLDTEGRVEGDPAALARLVHLGRLTIRWYGIAGLAAAVLIGAAGSLFFAQSPTPTAIAWQGSWLLLCALTGMKMWLIPVWALLEGCNQVVSLYRFRFFNAVVGGAATAGALASGLGLWSPSVGMAAELLFGAAYLARCHGPFLRSFATALPDPEFRWTREILPLQLRIAGSWVAGYFVSSLFTPVLFHFQGAREAGQWGMTWSMFGMVTSISMLWVSTKAPQFGVWIATGDYDSLDREFFRSMRLSMTVTLIGALSIWAGIWFAHARGFSFAGRILPPMQAGFLAVAVVVMSAPVAQSIYLRAHKREPLTLPSVVQAALIAALAVIFGRSHGSLGTSAAYLAVTVVVAAPWSMILWSRCRKEWHAQGPTG